MNRLLISNLGIGMLKYLQVGFITVSGTKGEGVKMGM